MPSWSFLQPGDPVALLATSGAFSDFSKRFQAIQGVADLFGLRTLFRGEFSPDSTYQRYYAAPLEERARALKEALLDPEMKAILLLRGGFGAMEILRLWETQGEDPFQNGQPKPIVGFSDGTHFLNKATQADWPAFHGPMAAFCMDTNDQATGGSLREIFEVLTGQTRHLSSSWDPLWLPPNWPQTKRLLGTVRGGNLSVLQRQAGTASAFQGGGTFVFLEDNEPAPNRQLDLFLHLLRSQAFGTAENPTKAILFGSLTVPQEDTHFLKETAALYGNHLLQSGLSIPILHNPGFGHSSPKNILPFGTKATLDFQGTQPVFLNLSTN